MFVASFLIAKHNDFNIALFTEFNVYILVLSTIFTVFVVSDFGRKIIENIMI